MQWHTVDLGFIHHRPRGRPRVPSVQLEKVSLEPVHDPHRNIQECGANSHALVPWSLCRSRVPLWKATSSGRNSVRPNRVGDFCAIAFRSSKVREPFSNRAFRTNSGQFDSDGKGLSSLTSHVSEITQQTSGKGTVVARHRGLVDVHMLR